MRCGDVRLSGGPVDMGLRRGGREVRGRLRTEKNELKERADKLEEEKKKVEKTKESIESSPLLPGCSDVDVLGRQPAHGKKFLGAHCSLTGRYMWFVCYCFVIAVV